MLLAAGAGATLPAAARADVGSHAGGRLLVTVRDGSGSPAATTATVDAALAATGSTVHATDALGSTAAVRVRGTEARAALKDRLARDPQVAQVVEEGRAVPRSLPSDPVLRDRDPLAPVGTTQAWWAQRLHLPEAWEIANGTGTRIAVIDSGFDLTHPQLQPIVDQALTSQIAGIPGTARTDENGHGTHVASLACSAFNDGAGTVGAGGRCRLVTIKTDFYDLSVARAVRRATALGVDAIVMSFGTDGRLPASAALKSALRTAAAKGVVLVAAAADDGPTEEQGWPANVLQPTGTGADRTAGIGLTVTAATAADARADYAGYGSQISLAAYGSHADGDPGIIGAFPAARAALEDDRSATRTAIRGDTRYAYARGTSFAVPMVAGIAALVRSTNPDLDATAINQVLKDTARRPAGWTPNLGWGVVDAKAAVEAAQKIDLRAPAATFASSSRTITGPTADLAWRGTDRSPAPLVPSGVRTVELWRSVDGSRFTQVGSARRGLRVEVPRGEVRYSLRAVDRAGNRAKLSVKRAITVTRR